MRQLIPAAILLFSLSPATAQSEPGFTIGPLAQGFFPDRDDDRGEPVLPGDGDSDPSNFEPTEIDPSTFELREGDSDPSNFEPDDGDSDPDNFERINLDQLPLPVRPSERALA